MSYDPYRKRLGEAARARRLSLGLNQGDLKALGGPGVVAVGQIERAEGPTPTGLTLAGLDRALRWAPGSAEALFNGTQNEPSLMYGGGPITVLEGDLRPEVHPVGLGLDAEADGLPPEDVEAVRAQVRALKRARGLDTT